MRRVDPAIMVSHRSRQPALPSKAVADQRSGSDRANEPLQPRPWRLARSFKWMPARSTSTVAPLPWDTRLAHPARSGSPAHEMLAAIAKKGLAHAVHRRRAKGRTGAGAQVTALAFYSLLPLRGGVRPAAGSATASPPSSWSDTPARSAEAGVSHSSQTLVMHAPRGCCPIGPQAIHSRPQWACEKRSQLSWA